MKTFVSLMAALALVVAAPVVAGAKKKPLPRGIVESMQAVSCGVKQHGLSGLGALYGSVGVTHMNADEKLCPQYLFRTDEMDYSIRPVDKKHPVVLPVGQEGEFKIKKDHLYLKILDGDKKMRAYQVVSIAPVQNPSANRSYQPARQPAEYRPPENPANRQAMNETATRPPNQSETPPPK